LFDPISNQKLCVWLKSPGLQLVIIETQFLFQIPGSIKQLLSILKTECIFKSPAFWSTSIYNEINTSIIKLCHWMREDISMNIWHIVNLKVGHPIFKTLPIFRDRLFNRRELRWVVSWFCNLSIVHFFSLNRIEEFYFFFFVKFSDWQSHVDISRSLFSWDEFLALEWEFALVWSKSENSPSCPDPNSGWAHPSHKLRFEIWITNERPSYHQEWKDLLIWKIFKCYLLKIDWKCASSNDAKTLVLKSISFITCCYDGFSKSITCSTRKDTYWDWCCLISSVFSIH
jgi:hypothetical protein